MKKLLGVTLFTFAVVALCCVESNGANDKKGPAKEPEKVGPPKNADTPAAPNAATIPGAHHHGAPSCPLANGGLANGGLANGGLANGGLAAGGLGLSMNGLGLPADLASDPCAGAG